MRLVADENFPKVMVDWLRQQDHDIQWARVDYPSWGDARLLDLAERESRILLTLDKDFWQIALQRRAPLRHSGVVHFRVHPATVARLTPFVLAFQTASVDWAGHVSRISGDGIQVYRVG